MSSMRGTQLSGTVGHNGLTGRMDYHAIHGHDVSSFDLPSTHRLPTVSAAEALEELDGDDRLQYIPTRLAAFDEALGAAPGIDSGNVGADLHGLGIPRGGGGGIQMGQVTEIWGPPGVGKTSFGIQLATSCLQGDGGVVWVDGFHRLPVERLHSTVGSAQEEGLNQRFVHYTCPSLAHFIALLCRPIAACIPAGTNLIVVDSLSALVNHAFPKTPDNRTDAKGKGGNKGPSKSATRLQVLRYIVSALQKLAATRNVAIVILTQCATKMQAERGATLIPAINANIWEQGISTRLVLFHDWVEDGEDCRTRHLRFVGIQKLHGKACTEALDHVCAFDIQPSGLLSVEYDNTQTSAALLSTPAPKRKLADTNFEVADSEDEDYDWQIDDEDLPPNPSQWQGSEDLLLLPHQSDDEVQDKNDVEDPDAAEVREGHKRVESGDES